MTTPTKRIAAAISIALVAAATGPGCGQILGIPDRVQGLNVTCDDATCVCDAGFGDCEDDLGCETGLGDDPAHCGACHHDCAGGGCVDGRCEPAPELFVGELFTGPVVFGDTLFIVDRETGDLLSSPASGPGAFVPARKNPQPTEYESDLFAGPDGLYVLLVPHVAGTGKREVLRLSETGEVIETFASIGGTHHSDNGVVATSDAVYVTDGWDITRIDRVTLARTAVTDDADSPARVIGDDVYYLRDDSVFVLHPGGGPEEFVFEEPQFLMCDLFVGTRYFILQGCGNEAFRIHDAQGGLLAQEDGSVRDAVEHDGTIYWLNDQTREVGAYDGASPRSIVESELFGEGTYRIRWFDGSLYWGSAKGVRRLVL